MALCRNSGKWRPLTAGGARNLGRPSPPLKPRQVGSPRKTANPAQQPEPEPFTPQCHPQACPPTGAMPDHDMALSWGMRQFPRRCPGMQSLSGTSKYCHRYCTEAFLGKAPGTPWPRSGSPPWTSAQGHPLSGSPDVTAGLGCSVLPSEPKSEHDSFLP